MSASALLAAGLTILGALLVYAGAVHQRLVATRRPILRWPGWALLAIALGLLLRGSGTPAALFTWAILAMLVWSTVPLAAAWWTWRGGQRR